MQKTLIAVFAAACLSGCFSSIPPAQESGEVPVTPAVFSGSAVISGSGASAVYLVDARRRPENLKIHALFFAQGNDPFSIQTDRRLKALYASGALTLSVERVDFGSSSGTRLDLGVVLPDTVVVLSASGSDVQSMIHPSDADLLFLLHPQATHSSSSRKHT